MSQHHDPLTGLPDRLALDRGLKPLIGKASGAALAALDLDHFLEINAEHGSETGDRVLQTLARLLAEHEQDHVYHITGDEFAIIMPGLGLEEAFLRMDSLRKQIEGAAQQFGLPNQQGVTVTIGVAQHPRDAKDARSLLDAATAALQAAKEGGRNRVGLPPNEEMIMKSCYYPATSVRKLKALAERLSRKESHLLREALDDLFRKYDIP
ncbi:MAG: diguanylate cyclase domain-containing protein [Roseiflexaceae bacterium]